MTTPGAVGLTRAEGPAPAGLEALLTERWSCRAFLEDPVPRPLLEACLRLAGLTPSWCNSQSWHVHITEGNATLRFRTALLAHVAGHPPQPDFAFPERYEGVYGERRRACAWQLYESAGIALGDRDASAAQTARNFEFFGAPHVAVITTEADLGVYGAIDCGLYVQSLLLALTARGLGAIPQAALAAYSDFIRDYLGLAENRRVVCGISLGWPDRDDPVNQFRTTRVPAEDSVSWLT